jgi:two-component system cell cycle sensor histidine kinase/response regulator CckA
MILILASLSLFFFLVIIAVSTYVLIKNPGNRINQAFFLYLLITIITTLARFISLLVEQQTIRYVSTTVTYFWPFVIFLLTLFVFVYTGKVRFIIFRVILFVMGALASLITVIFIYDVLAVFKEGLVNEIERIIYETTLIAFFSSSYSIILSFIAIILLLIYTRRIESRYKKREAFIILTGVVAQVVTAMTFEGILPGVLKINIQYFASIGFITSLVCIGYSVNYYQLFEINPAMAIDNILSTMPDGLLLVKKNLEIVYTNQAIQLLSGYPQLELHGTGIHKLFNRPEKYFEDIIYDLDQGYTRSIDLVVYHKANREIPVSISASAFFSKAYNRTVGYLFLLRDVTERERLVRENQKLEGQLIQANKMEAIGHLAGGIAHDFNNLLGAISILTEDLQDEYESEEYIQSVTETILSSTDKARDLISKILGFARKGKLEMRPISIHKAIEGVVDITSRTIKKSVTLEIFLDAEQDMVVGDFNQIQNALINLVINADDAMPDGGVLTIRTKTVPVSDPVLTAYNELLFQSDHVIVWIEDNGTGIPEDVRERIFEPFYTTKSEKKGTGLGLSSVFGTIQNHEGIIIVESTPGKGTSFMIALPVTTRKDTGSKQAGNEERIMNPSDVSILVVDDDASFLGACQSTLAREEYGVTTYSNPLEALAWYRENYKTVTLILLDVIMPEMDGNTFYIEAKKVNPDVKVVIMTGYAVDGAASRILEAGACAYITKPFKKNDLFDRINTILFNEKC